MKKAILMIAVLAVAIPGMCQEKFYQDAYNALQNNNLDEAKEDIDKAMQSGDMKEKPKALFLKAEIYFGMELVDKYKKDYPYREGTQTVLKLAEVKPDHEKDKCDQYLLFGASNYYNDGAKEYKAKNYAEATELMKMVIKIHDLNGGKRFEKFQHVKNFDTMAANAELVLANACFVQQKYEDAIPLLTKVVGNKITKSPNAYNCLVQSYNELKKTSEAFAAIEEGRKDFPNDEMLRKNELNYYITSGKQDELVKKLEEAAANEPTNADIQFDLATAYLQMANPKDGKKPANYDELNKKSEAAFQNGLKNSPDNMLVNYNFGALYFNQAKDVNDQMNATPDNDVKKYNDLKAKRDELFTKALPYLEKSYNIAQPNETTLKGEDMKTYRETLQALVTIYAAQSKNDKSAEMNAKLKAMK